MITAFILSSPRSGSTLLRLTLNKMPGVFALPETHFFVFAEKNNLKKEFSSGADKKNIIARWMNYHTIRKWPVDHDDLRNHLENNVIKAPDILSQTAAYYLMKVKQLNAGEVSIIEKSPPHIFYQHFIDEWFPGTKKIFLVRDPRDVIASLKTCSWSTSNPFINAMVWKNGVKLITNGSYIKYENLVTNPEKEMSSVCKMLGIPFVPANISEETNSVIEEGNKTSKNSLKPISADFIGSYKNKLSKTDKELEIIQEVCKKEMIQFGYTSEAYKTGIKFWLMYLNHGFALLISKLR